MWEREGVMYVVTEGVMRMRVNEGRDRERQRGRKMVFVQSKKCRSGKREVRNGRIRARKIHG